MRRPRRQAVLILLVLVSLLSLSLPVAGPFFVAPAAATTGESVPGPTATNVTAATATNVTAATATNVTAATATATTAVDDSIDATTTLALTPERPGSVEATLRFDVPSQVTSLQVSLPPEATVRSTDGFDRTSDGYDWTGDARPSITYALDANSSESAEGPLTGEGKYSFVDAGPWALIREPGFGARWEWRGSGDVHIERSITTAGSGAVGNSMVYLGPYESYTRQAHRQRFRLIVPAAAEMAASPDAVLTTLSAASGELQVGDRDSTVFAVAAPTDSVGWTARGLQTGDTDFWVRDVEGLDTPANVWVHEYVHTRQAFATQTDSSATWLTEGMANYYAALLTLESGDTTFSAFSRELADGSDSRYDDTVLADPGTWARHAQYAKGALVAGEMDRRIRLATGRTNSFENVFAQLNDADGTVDDGTLQSAIGLVTNASVASRLDQYATTSATPSMWSREQHRAAFGPVPAMLATTVPASDYRLSGPYRNRTTATLPTLVTGETVAFDVRVTNSGGQTGTFEIPVRANDTLLTTLTGSVGGRNSTTRTVEYTVTEPGRTALTVGDATVSLFGSRPATPTVTALRTDPATPTPGATVAVTATVRNDAPIPGERTLQFRTDEGVLANRSVRLDADSAREVTVLTAFESGTYRLTVDNASTSLTVTPDPTTTAAGEPASGADTTPASGPGFTAGGVFLALLALAVSLLLLDRRD